MFDKTQLAWSPSGAVSLMPARCHQAGLGGSSARHPSVPVACHCYRASPAPSLLPQLLSCRNVSRPCADSGASLTFLWVEPAADKTREFPWTKGSFWLERGGGESVCVCVEKLVGEESHPVPGSSLFTCLGLREISHRSCVFHSCCKPPGKVYSLGTALPLPPPSCHQQLWGELG